MSDSSLIDSSVAHYTIVEKLGEGGMGEVYRAADGKLRRDVALKVLPQEFTLDAERMARFEREAHVLASLNHPNIAAIYGLEKADGIFCLVLELVEGPTLAERLERGPIRLDDALPLALEIAGALEAAHERGIVHRDLKPANIKLTAEGAVKVLDFGLAKARESEGAGVDLSHSPTMTAGSSVPGMILGTAAYMSPEQAAGKPVDRRTDIWSFGVVLHEMLTARKLFPGDTVTEVIAGVIAREPELGELPALPRRLEELLRRCLRKDPRSRLRDMGDARVLLEEILSGEGEVVAGAPAAAATPAISRGRRLAQAAGALALAALAAVTAWNLKPAPAPERSPLKFEIPVVEGSARLIRPALSPDGSRLVYGSEGRLWLRSLAELESVEIPGTEGASNPFWSSDGRWLAFGKDQRLWKVSTAGGEPDPITRLGGVFGAGAGGVWGDDGRIVLTTGTSGLLRVSAQGGDLEQLLAVEEGEADFHDVSALPGGRGYLFVIHYEREGFDTLGLVSGGERRVLLELDGHQLGDPVYVPSGHILFQRRGGNGGVWAVPFSLRRLEITGDPFLVVSQGSMLSASADGTLVYVPGVGRQRMVLSLYGRDGTVERVLDTQTAGSFPSFSPDGKKVAYSELDDAGWQVWVDDLERGTRSRMSFEPGSNTGPRWTPDGERLFYFAGATRSTIVSADGSRDAEALADAGCWRVSVDGFLICSRGPRGGDIVYRPLDGDDEFRTFLEGPPREMAPDFSPDGRYVVYQSDESGHDEVYIRPFPDGDGRWQVSPDGGNWPRWSPRGDEIFYARGADIMTVGIGTDPKPVLEAPRILFTREATLGVGINNWPDGFDVSPDGRLFVTRTPEGPETPERSVVVVRDWVAEFE